MLAWWSLTPTPECSSIITQHQLARDGRGRFSLPNGGMFVLTQRETHFGNRRRVSFCETSHMSLHALTAQSTHTHLNPGLHGDCFSAHVNLPPASVSRFVRRVKEKKRIKKAQLLIHDHMIIFIFYSVLWAPLKPQERRRGNKQSLISLFCKSLFLFYWRSLKTQFKCLPSMHPSWRFTLLTRRESCLLRAKVAV